MNVLLQYLSLPDYRRTLFSELSEDKRINFEIVCGESSPYPFLKNYIPSQKTEVTYIRNKYIKFGKITLTWQQNIFKTIANRKPDCVIMLGVDPTIISNFPLFLYLKILGIKVLWWSHGTLGHQGIIGRYFRLIFYRLSDGILLYNNEGLKRLKKYNIDKQKLFVVNNCINNESYKNATINLFKKKINIIFSGRIESRKKLEILIRAVKLFKERNMLVKLDIIGTGPLRQTLETLVKDIKIEKEVTFHGALYGGEADKLISNANVGIIPGDAGLSVIHYMAQGLPAITNNNLDRHGPEVSAIKNGENGYFFEDDDCIDLVKKILLTIKNLEVMSKNAIFTAQQYYSPEYVKEKIIKATNKVCRSYA